MIAPLATALSGMLAQTGRVDAAASNLANQQSRGYQPIAAATVAQPGGGAATVYRPITPAILPGTDGTPNVDSGQNLLTLKSASTAYKTNLTVAKTTDAMARDALRLIA